MDGFLFFGLLFGLTAAVALISDDDDNDSTDTDEGSGEGSGETTNEITDAADLLTYGEEDDVVSAGGGDDTVMAGGGNDTVSGGGGADVLFGEEGEDLLDGGVGEDIAYGGEGGDTLTGGGGDDFLFGDDGADLLQGEGGDDELTGGEGSDTLEGGEGDDFLYGGSFDRDLTPEEIQALKDGEDIADYAAQEGAGSADVLDGGAGNDSIVLDKGDTGTGGEDADFFDIYFDSETEGVITITDYVDGEDVIEINLSEDETEDDYEVVMADNGQDAEVVKDGEVVLVVVDAADTLTSTAQIQFFLPI